MVVNIFLSFNIFEKIVVISFCLLGSQLNISLYSTISSLLKYLLKILHCNKCGWLSSHWPQSWHNRSSFLYLYLKFVLQSMYLDLRANNKHTYVLLKSVLVMYCWVSKLLYCTSFILECWYCFSFRYTNAAFLGFYSYDSVCFYWLYLFHLKVPW